MRTGGQGTQGGTEVGQEAEGEGKITGPRCY
jgi:hypothetical protein